MTEPVAYLNKYLDNSTNITRYKPENQRLLSSNPLYTAEQLHPRVKMTQAEFDEWKELYYRIIELSLTAYKMLNEILDSTHNNSGKYTKLAKRVYQDNDFMSVSKKQAELANLFVNYSPDNPEKTIEIVPDMKWFVQRNDTKDRYRFLSKDIVTSDNEFNYSSLKYSAKQFDTKEKAEKWTNPLTEAVQLAVEDE